MLPVRDGWAARFHRFTNRLAHAHLLSDLNAARARLVFLHLVGALDLHSVTGLYGHGAFRHVSHEDRSAENRGAAIGVRKLETNGRYLYVAQSRAVCERPLG